MPAWTTTTSVLAFPQAPDAIELRHLRAFVAVAEELNFGRAAERLYVSQPALSRQIRALERLVGCELLRRSTHRVELTLAGEALLDRARRLLARPRRGGLRHAVGRAASCRAASRSCASRSPSWPPPTPTSRSMRAAYEALHACSRRRRRSRCGRSTRAASRARCSAAGPDGRRRCCYLHGGGYMLGSAFGYRPLAGALAAAAGTGALVPDYRLAPEHPFPAALDDAVRAYRWLLDRGDAPEHVDVAGDSSGGGLSMSLLLTLRERGPAAAGRRGAALPGRRPRRRPGAAADDRSATRVAPAPPRRTSPGTRSTTRSSARCSPT